MNTKYVFITGGVVSGLGKGITASSLGRLLKNRGYKVVNQKFDPYINVDPGTMSPYEHGEVFVTDDGAETDLDLGHYERFTDVNLTRNSSITSGKIYQNVINKERNGDYLGKTVQVIPHVTNEIKDKIYSFENSDVDVVITELGGTVGDIESLAFIEAIRQVGLEKAPEDVLYIHVTLLPYISGSNELKSKPTQHSVKELQSFGIKPDILVCRSEIEISDEIRQKLALFCNVRPENVIPNLTADNLYAVPIMLEEQGLAVAACKHLHLDKIEPKNEEWEAMLEKVRNLNKEVKIALVGKYMLLQDSYLSVAESLRHGGFANSAKVDIGFIDSETINKENVKEILKDCNLYNNVPTLVSCPTCGRTQIDLIPMAKEVEEFLQTINSDITVAVMGCAVNGPGEASNADIGIAGGIKEGLLFKKGKIIRKIPQENIVNELKEEILKMIEG
mgnify:CR=1 FL=1